MRTRPVLLTAACAAVGLAAFGTVVAQQPGAAPPPTVRPYADWTPTPPPPGYSPKTPTTGVVPAGGYLQPPPGYTPVSRNGQPVGTTPRPTQPVMAGPDGVRPAGGFDVPPPSMELPAPGRPGTGAIPPGAGMAPPPVPFPPPGKPVAPPLSADAKFPPTPPAPPAPVMTPPAPPAPSAAVPPAHAVPPAPATTPAPLPTIAEKPPVPAPGTIPPVPPNTTPTPTPGLGDGQHTKTTPPAATPAPAATTLAPGAMPARSTPSVVVEAVCPETVVYGQEFQYKLIVRNTGTTPVAQVRVEDELPAGSRYSGSDPTGELNGDRLVWTFPALEAGAEKHIAVRVRPAEEGDVRSRATVTFAAAVDARTKVTRPRLAVSVAGAEVCRAGEDTTFNIKVTNSGSGPATKLTVQARLADGLFHPQAQGVMIEAPLDSLPPGETRTVPLKVAAVKAGLQWCQIVVVAEGSPDASAKASVNVVEPMLVVKQHGPAHCLVRAEPVYAIELSNPGTAATDPVQVHTVLPDGFELALNGASDGGMANGRAVTWRLPSLAAGSSRTLTLKLRAVAATDAQGSLLRTIAQAGPAALTPAAAPAKPSARGLEAKAETVVVAEGVAAVRFEVVGLDNPVAVGKEVTYEIRVMNQGTGPCANVQLAAVLADGTEFVGAAAGANQGGAVKAQGQHLTFDPIPALGVKGEMVYRVRVKGNAPGDLRFRVQLSCDQLKTPVVKEESTTFVKE